MTYHTEMESNVLKRLTERYMREVIQIGLYQKIIDEAVNHTPLEAEMAKQIDKQQEQINALRDVVNHQHEINKKLLSAMEKRLPRTFAQKMDAIGKLPGPNGSIFK